MTPRWSDYTVFCVILCLHVNIVQGLRFIDEPADNIVALGSTFWWDCVATDTSPVTYSWTINGNSLPVHGNLVVFGNGTLHIRKISADDIGVYTCTAETSGGQMLQSREATLQLAYIDPSFTLNPQAKTVLLGDNVILACKIGSLPTANITWLLNGEVVTLGAATQDENGESTLTLSPVMYYGAGEYKCLGVNPLLQVYRYSLGAELVVRGTPVFLASLESVSVPQGFKATFNCYFHGNPEPSLTWFVHTTAEDGQVSTRELFSSDKYNINPNGTLTIHDVTDADQAFYTCSVSNIFGQMSESAELNVTGAASIPEFSQRPQNITANAGDDVTIQCKASGNPVPDIVWLKDEAVIPTQNGIQQGNGEGELTLFDLQPQQSGQYICMAENDMGSVNASFHVNVQVSPSFILAPSDKISLVGQQFVLNCKAEGNPKPSIIWSTPQYGQVDLITSPPGITLLNDGTLVVSSATFDDAGIYTCIARNVVEYKQTSASVKIESPPEFIQQPVSQSINKGGTVYFHCQSSGVPTPTFAWSKDGEGVIVSTPQRQIYLNHTLVIRSVNQSDAGIYRCTASNRHDSILAVATLTVTVPPTFTVKPENQTVYIGSKVELRCDSSGDPVPSQSWRKDGRYLYTADNINVKADGTLLSIDDIKESQFGDYTCIASNLAGTLSVSAWIKLYDAPVITVFPQNTTVNQSGTVTFQCKGESQTEAPTVVWYKEESGGEKQVTNNNRVTLSADGDLQIQNIEPGDEGWYRCDLSNPAGTVSAQLYLDVYVLPRIIYTNSPQTTVHQSSVILTCQSTGDPPPTVEWINPAGTKISSSPSYLIQSDFLEIVAANQNSDDGDWICQSCNIVGCIDTVLQLSVNGLPLIDSFKAYKVGDAIKLECKVKGQPVPSITYTTQGQVVTGVTKGHKLQNNILTVEKDHVKKEYTCTAANKYGSDSLGLTAPNQMPAPSITSLGSTWVIIDLTNVDSESDLPLTTFNIQTTINDGRTWQNVLLKDSVTSNSTNISSLLPHTEYNFRIAAENILGFGKFSEMSASVQTLPDAPSPPTNLAALHIDEGTILFSWSPSQFINGDRADVAYLFTITLDGSDTFYMSDMIYSNGTLQVEVHDIHSSGLYTFTVKAVNIKIDKSSSAVSFTVDLRIPNSERQTKDSSSSKVYIILAGVASGIIVVCLIIFVALRIRRRKKSESLSFIKPRLSLDQFYMENPKQLYGSETRLGMKRSRSSNSFYSFTNDDSFHSNRSLLRDSIGLSPSKRKSDGDVLLMAKNPLYTDNTLSMSTQSSRVNSPEPLLCDSLEQSCLQHEIELPSADMVSHHSTGSGQNSLHSGKTGNQNKLTAANDRKEPLSPLSAKNLEDDINSIYSSMKYSEKPNLEQSLEHIYASIHSDGQSSRSKGFSLSSNNSTYSSDPNQPKPPIRVLSVDQLSSSPPDGTKDGKKKWRLSRSASPGRSESISPTVFTRSEPTTKSLHGDKLHVSADSYDTDKDLSSNVEINTDDSDKNVDQTEEHSQESADSDKTDKYPATKDDTDINDSNTDIDEPLVHSKESSTKDICDNDICNGSSPINEENSNSQINKEDNNSLSNKKDNIESISNEEDTKHELLDDVTNHDMNINGDVYPVKTLVPESEGSGEFLLVTTDNNNRFLRSKIEDNFLTDEQIKEEAISAELY